MSETCAAVTWNRPEHDYEACSYEAPVDLCIIEAFSGNLFVVKVPLCRAHQLYFIKNERWILRDPETNREIAFDRGERYLTQPVAEMRADVSASIAEFYFDYVEPKTGEGEKERRG